jgi:hypothetical protein
MYRAEQRSTFELPPPRRPNRNPFVPKQDFKITTAHLDCVNFAAVRGDKPTTIINATKGESSNHDYARGKNRDSSH